MEFREYPKWVKGVIVNNREEEAKLNPPAPEPPTPEPAPEPPTPEPPAVSEEPNAESN